MPTHAESEEADSGRAAAEDPSKVCSVLVALILFFLCLIPKGVEDKSGAVAAGANAALKGAAEANAAAAAANVSAASAAAAANAAATVAAEAGAAAAAANAAVSAMIAALRGAAGGTGEAALKTALLSAAEAAAAAAAAGGAGPAKATVVAGAGSGVFFPLLMGAFLGVCITLLCVNEREREQHPSESNRDSRSRRGLCCACLTSTACVLFKPCKHLATCRSCLNGMIGANATRCPMCNLPYETTEEVYTT